MPSVGGGQRALGGTGPHRSWTPHHPLLLAHLRGLVGPGARTLGHGLVLGGDRARELGGQAGGVGLGRLGP